MKKGGIIALDFEIDVLTNSIQNTISGDSFQTEISQLKLGPTKARVLSSKKKKLV